MQDEAFLHGEQGKESYRLRLQLIERVFADAKERYALRLVTLFQQEAGRKKVLNQQVESLQKQGQSLLSKPDICIMEQHIF